MKSTFDFHSTLDSHLAIQVSLLSTGRKQEIIKLTEQLIAAITSGDFEGYTYVDILNFSLCHLVNLQSLSS